MKEVGAVLGGSEGAAKLRLHRAMQKLRQFFCRRGIVSTAETLAEAISANGVQAAPIGLAKTATALALTQGPAASASILNLIQGALKIMAWTKAKTLIMAGVVVLFAAGTTPVVIMKMSSHAHSPIRSEPRTIAATKTIQGQFFGPGQLIDAGDTTPEAAWETRYWARAIGDYDAVIAATAPAAVEVAKAWMGDKTTFHARSQTDFASFLGFQILARKNLAGDTVELKYQFGFRDGNSPQQTKPQETKIVKMVEVNDVWRCRETRAYEASWDEGSELEPQS
jgi:hypothetical protein